MKTLHVFACAAIIVCPAIASAAPVLYYDFEGGTFTNLGTFGGVGSTPSGVPTFQADATRGGDVGNFGGASDFVNTGVTAAASVQNQSYTATTWLNTTGGTGGGQFIFGQTGGNSMHNGVRNNNFEMDHWGSNNTTSATTPDNSGWTHVAYQFDTTGNRMRIFVNGELKNDVGPRNVETDGNPIVIGTRRQQGDNDYNGLLDETGIFNAQAFSAAEVRSIFQLSVAPGQDPAVNVGETRTEFTLPAYLGYDLNEIGRLLDLHQNGTVGDTEDIDGQTWELVDTLDASAPLGLNADGDDLFLLLDNSGGGQNGTGLLAAANVIPEPASLAIWSLVAIGLVGGFFWRSKKGV